MRKHFLTSEFQVGSNRIIRQLIAILKPRDGSQSFPAKISQQVLKQVVRDGGDCHQSRIDYDRGLRRFSSLPSLPQYKHKISTRNLFTSDNQSIEKREINPNKGLIHLSQSDLIIFTESQDVIKVRVVPATALYFFEVANQKPVTLVNLNYILRSSRDLGSDRLVVLASNKPTFTSTIYCQKHFPSINQGFNQRRAFLLSKVDLVKYIARPSQPITFNRNKRLENYLHQTCSLIVKRLGHEKIIQLMIGINVRGKKNIKIEKQHHYFGVITPTQIVKFITCKTELVGSKVIVTQAYYTNKCRFGDLGPVGKQESYQGKSGKRGSFRSRSESRIDADVNAALKMIKKVNPNSPP
ncbi:transposase [Microcoleus sp. F8-D3]